MVQINLPENSQVKKGKYFKDKTGSKNLRKVNVYRWDPSTGENPRIDTYEVDMDNCPSKVLDVLNKIKNEIDPSIAYRRSCAHGVCGSCAMNMGGKNGLACTTPHSEIDGDIDIYPLPHLKVKKDLIGDLDGLYKQYQSIEPWLKSNSNSETTEIIQSKKDRAKNCFVIDNSSHYRMDPEVPLIVPQVNSEDLNNIKKNIIANPNCSTAQLVIALKPLHDLFTIKRVVVSTYQSVSGGGKAPMDELIDQTKMVLNNQKVEPRNFTKQIAFNIIPHIDIFSENGYTKEELKMVNETKSSYSIKHDYRCPRK